VVVVDTSVWIDYLNGANTAQAERLDHLLGERLVVVGDLVLAELMQGFASEDDASQVRRSLEPLPFAEMVGKENALAAAANFRELRRRGVTVRKTIDVLIGTFCLENDLELLHADRDFDAMAEHLGLRVVRV
jgi:predicted nucleic acid-binding protein